MLDVEPVGAGRRSLATPHLLAGMLCLGLGLSLLRPPHPGLTAAGSALVALVAVAIPRGRIPLLAIALLLCGIAAGATRLARLDDSVLSGHVGDSGPAVLEVTGPARLSTFGSRVPVRVRELWHRPLHEPALLRLPAGRSPPQQGALLELIVSIREPRAQTEPGGFDEREYLGRQGIHAVLAADRYRTVGARDGIAGLADRVRSAIGTGLTLGVDGERRALVSGIVLGADEGLSEELRENFRRSGLFHLLAVSGQNVAYVAVGVVLLAWLLGVPRLLAEGAAIGAIVAYVAAVGWQPSVVRAGVAGGLASLAWISSRPRDRWYFALVGAAVLLAWNPYSLLDAGFQLSFAAVAAIFIVAPRIEARLDGYPLPRPLVSVLAISIACSVATAPILWARFGALPVLAVAANALAAPVVAPILGLGMASAVLGHLLPTAATAVGWLNGWLVAYLAWIARTIGDLPVAQVSSQAALVVIVLVAVAVVAAFRAPPRFRRTALGIAVVAVIATVAWYRWPAAGERLGPPAGLRIAFLDVGQGDAILLQVAEHAVLIDQGPPEANVAGRLARFGIDRLAALVLTHPERDHIGGAADVLERLAVDTVLEPGLPTDSADQARALDSARARGSPVRVVRAGDVLTIGRLNLRVLSPDGPGLPGDNPNLHAIVILATYGRVEALLTADAESEVTGRLELPEVEILKVAHHGSSDPGLPGLLDRLRPALAVISVGLGNDYGHPRADTVSALTGRKGLALYRTDRDGTVLVETDGERITVQREA